LKPTDFTPPDPNPSPAAGGGRLALAAEGEGAGDAFNLSGNPGGRGLLSGGGLGDGSGEGAGEVGGTGARFGWYYARVASEVEDVFRRAKELSSASARVELRLWIDSSGRITRAEPLQAGADRKVQDAIRSLVGQRISQPPPAEIPMPMIARLTARRPQ
jgi:hypothetical protein